MRFEPDGEATRLVVDSDYEMPGKLPGFIKDLMGSGWMEGNIRRMLEDFKALAEAQVPARGGEVAPLRRSARCHREDGWCGAGHRRSGSSLRGPRWWIRSLVQRLGCSACRILTLLGKGADDRCDCRADDASAEVMVEEQQAREVPAQ